MKANKQAETMITGVVECYLGKRDDRCIMESILRGLPQPLNYRRRLFYLKQVLGCTFRAIDLE